MSKDKKQEPTVPSILKEKIEVIPVTPPTIPPKK